MRWICILIGVLLAGCVGTSSPVPGEETTAQASEDTTRIAFRDVTQKAGLSDFQHFNGGVGDRWMPEITGGGGGFLDYDGDGWLDVALVAGGAFPSHGAAAIEAAGPALRLYRNRGDGTFEEVTDEAGLGGLRAYALGVASSDYDNDGDVDVLVTTLGRDVLLRNEGGVFVDVTEASGLGGVSQWSSSALFFEADGDGDADLYIGGYVDWSPEKDVSCLFRGEKVFCTPEVYDGVSSRFYRNNGDGTFTDATIEAGFLSNMGKTFGVAELDYDQDGRPDLVVANDTQPDQLYHNEGGGVFTEVGVSSGIAFGEDGAARAGMGIDAGPLEGPSSGASSSSASVVVGNFSHEMVGVYRHLGSGLFLDRAAASKLGYPSLKTLTFGLFLFDVELDGDLDLFTANGHVLTHIAQTQEGIAFRQPPHLFINDGEGRFHDVAPEVGGPLAEPLLARGASRGDYDRDGDTDVLVTQNGGGARLLRNETTGAGHVLRVRLRGQGPGSGEGSVFTGGESQRGGSQREGLSSEVEAVLPGGGRVVRRVRTGSSYLSQSESVAVLGLGRSEVVDTLVVRWSGGGSDRLEGVSSGQEVVVEEGRGIVEQIPLPVQPEQPTALSANH